MTAKGHVALAITPALIIADGLKSELYVLFLGFVFIGALLPDIDEPNSFIGKRLNFLSIPLKILGIEHRTFTHYLIFPFMLLLIASFVSNPYIQISVLGLSFGVLMHDIGDMLTKGGIKGFLYPFYKNKTFRVLPKEMTFYTNSIIEHIVIFILVLIDIFIVIKVLNIYELFNI